MEINKVAEKGAFFRSSKETRNSHYWQCYTQQLHISNKKSVAILEIVLS